MTKKTIDNCLEDIAKYYENKTYTLLRTSVLQLINILPVNQKKPHEFANHILTLIERYRIIMVNEQNEQEREKYFKQIHNQLADTIGSLIHSCQEYMKRQ